MTMKFLWVSVLDELELLYYITKELLYECRLYE